jgi:thiol-disulfide isomerase/thioredoxin
MRPPGRPKGELRSAQHEANPMNRRVLLVGAVGLVAGAAGLGGGAWWRSRAHGGDAPVVAGQAAVDVWAQRFEQPSGGELVLSKLNFWATWCPPCVTEMPLLDRFQTAQRGRGWLVVGLAVDSPTPVREFLARQPMGFSIGLAGLNGIDLARSLGNASGALPFSVVFDRQGKAVRTKLGSVHDADLASWVDAIG